MYARSAGLILLLGLGACRANEQPAKPAAAAASTQKSTSAQLGNVVLAEGGKSRVSIVVAPRLLAQEQPTGRKRPRRGPQQKRLATEEQRLRDSVADLALYLGKVSGAQVDVATSPSDASLPILIGEVAQPRFQESAPHAPGQQGFRYIVTPSAIALYGESDLATSYAIYELLFRLGCRWFMPGDIGEHVPKLPKPSLSEANQAIAPSTYYRSVWYADDAYKRRNRLGGTVIAAGHKLETWISKEQRQEHPEWRAVIKGTPHDVRLRWNKPEVADAIAAALELQLEKRGADSLSISPSDGVDFDETTDTAIDANDFDPTMNRVSLTDRLLVLANRVATKTTATHPNVLLGLLAYSSYTRPPVREHVHPNIVPVIAPITYCRQRPLSDDHCPGAADLRKIVVGWAARSSMLAYRSYAYNLAEPSAPHPMLAKWSFDLPFMFQHKVRFFQPETMPNFETTLPGLYLGIRLAWDSSQTPKAITDELFDTFYGHASTSARSYIGFIDHAWTDSNDFSGGGLGYGRRFAPATMKEARRLLNAAKAACATDMERRRVALLDESLVQFELYMKMYQDLRHGQLTHLEADLDKWTTRAQELSERYSDSFAFGKARWAGPAGVYANYVTRFLKPTYAEATRIAREQVLLSQHPICQARYRVAPDLKLPAIGAPIQLNEQDALTDFCTESWSALGRHDYFGAMWYQTKVPLGSLPAGKHVYLWLTNVDGVVQAWLNGTALRTQTATELASSTETHLKGVRFEISTAAQSNTDNELIIATQRTRLAELGGSGLLGPAFVYADR